MSKATKAVPESKATAKKLNIYKIYENATIPRMATKQSACFDLYTCFGSEKSVFGYADTTRKEISRLVQVDETGRFIKFNSMDRILIPTGLIFDIPEGYSVRLHARSGMVLKHGLCLANAEGIIDSDYIEPVFAMIINITQMAQKIYENDRVWQGELVRVENYSISEIKNQPPKKTERDGGFGSTGT